MRRPECQASFVQTSPRGYVSILVVYKGSTKFCCVQMISFLPFSQTYFTRLCYLYVKGKWQQKFLLSHLKETLKVIYKRFLQNFYICFTLGDIVT